MLAHYLIDDICLPVFENIYILNIVLLLFLFIYLFFIFLNSFLVYFGGPH